MSKSAKTWLIAAASLVTIGAIIFAAVMTVYRWDFSRLSTDHFETNTYEIKEEFSDIKVNTDTADIEFLPSKDSKCRIVCTEYENEKHFCRVGDEKLLVGMTQKRKWYEHFGIYTVNPKITFYLPEKECVRLNISESTGNIILSEKLIFESVDISITTGNIDFHSSVNGNIGLQTTTGNIKISDIFAKDITLSSTTGETFVSKVQCGIINTKISTGKTVFGDVSCTELVSEGTTGNISMKNVISENKISVTRSTGNIGFSDCDAKSASLITTTGNVDGNFKTDKIFITETSTGEKNFPKTTTGGVCEIKTTTGDINIR